MRLCGLILLLALTAPLVASAAGPLADPTRPSGYAPAPAAVAQKAAPPKLHLQAILVSPTRRVALINGRALKVGDHIDGAVILKIQPDRIVVRHRHRRLTFMLDSGSMTKTFNDSGRKTGIRK